jgi:hypothetical protein
VIINRLKYFFIFVFFLQSILSAQYYFFGRNKVQYNDFNWKVLKTDHFDIYYYDDFGEMAEIGANYAEEAFEEFKSKFNYLVTSRIPLIFYNTHIHFEQTNTTPGFIPEGVGGFFEFLKGRVVIPYLGSLSSFRHVIRHELVHVFMTFKILRILREHRLTTDRYPPLWFTEGLAEFWSTDWDTQAEMVMRDAVINNYVVGLSNMYQIYGSFLMYKEGQNLLDFINKTYGEEKIFYLLENFWQFDSFNEELEYVLNKKIEDIDKEWLFYLKQKYYPLVAGNVPPEYGSEKLTDFGFHFSPSYYTNGDKKYIYFIANRDGYSSIYDLELNPELKKEDRPAPDIVIRGEKEEVFESFHLLEPSLDISKNGIMAFVTKSGAADAIHFYSIKKKEILKTFQQSDIISISAPHWSVDNKKILFSATDYKGYNDIFEYNYENEILTRITNDYYSDIDPVYGKGDSTIVFASDRTDGIYKSKFNLFECNTRTHTIRYLTYCNADFRSPEFNSDFSELYFTCDYDGIQNIWKLNVQNEETIGMTRVTNFLTSVYQFTFTKPTELVISAFDNFSFQLYLFKINNNIDSSAKQITFNYDNSGNRWYAKKIKIDAMTDKLKYENKYTLDFAQSQVTTDPIYGTMGGAVFALSDLFSDDNYYFLIYNTAEVQSEFLRSFNVAISRLNIKNRTNYAYGLFHFSGRRYDIQDSDVFFYERSFGGYFTLYYPLSKFQRIEANATIANSDKEVISGLIERKALLMSNSLSYVLDNSLWGPTGPLDGMRIRLLLGYTSDVKYSNVNYFTVIADYRQYLRLAYKSCLAIRAAFFYNEGREARRYFMGGSWDLRGWPRWSIRGEKLWISSVELRFPLIDLLQIKFPVIEMGFPNLRGALFFDSGSAWDKNYQETLGSIGAGFRLNFFNVLTLRYDIGKTIQYNFTKLQNGLFYQFFFGWDF